MLVGLYRETLHNVGWVMLDDIGQGYVMLGDIG